MIRGAAVWRFRLKIEARSDHNYLSHTWICSLIGMSPAPHVRSIYNVGVWSTNEGRWLESKAHRALESDGEDRTRYYMGVQSTTCSSE